MGVDRRLGRMYERMGLRILSAALLATYGYGLIFGWAMCGIFAYMTGMSRAGQALLSLQWAAEYAALLLLARNLLRRVTKPLAGPGRDASSTEVWIAARQLPTSVAKAVVVGALVLAPLHALSIWWVAPETWRMFVAYTLGYVLMTLPNVVFLLFALQIALRPVISSLPPVAGLPAASGAISVRSRLLVAYPAIIFVPLMVGLALATGRGHLMDKIGTLFDQLFIGLGLVAVWIVPLVLMVGYATLAPLNDLLRTAKALGKGDLSVRVPEISADEHGVLARAFNDAIRGLEDSVRIARENERLQTELAEARARVIVAADADRVRLERHLYDGARQQLIALALRIQTMRDRTSEPATAAALAVLEESIDAALEELGSVTYGVHPPVLETDGLRPAIEHLAARAALVTHVDAVGGRFARPVEEAVYQVASEALANAVKYAHASSVDISIEADDHELTVKVHDDGVGGARRGPGLAGLEDRIAALGGRLKFLSPDGHGTEICAMIPL